MDDARRFLRYLIPGSLYVLETVFVLLFVAPTLWTQILTRLDGQSGAGSAVAALLGSGAIGFLLSTVHHWLFWRFPDQWGCADYRELISRLQQRRFLTILGWEDEHTPESNLTTPKAVSVHQAWILVTAIWHERAGSSMIKAANGRADSLANIVHSLGAAKVGCWAATMSAVTIAHWNGYLLFQWRASLLLAIFIVGLLFIVHHVSYRNALYASQCIVEEVLTDALGREFEKNNQRPVCTRMWH